MKNRELPEYLAKQGISRHIKESNSYDKNTFRLPWQGCGVRSISWYKFAEWGHNFPFSK